MAFKGPDFYDNQAIFDTYMSRRQRADNPNDTLEKPVIWELAGEVTGERIFDLGCGDAVFGREALAKGCKTYLGIEGSSNMTRVARQVLAGTDGSIEQANIEEWTYPAQAFDLVISRLVFHYIRNIDALFEKVYQALVNDGRFVFSIEHPVITSCDRAWQGKDQRQDWLVDDYFETGKRITSWMGGQVVKYHRTIESYFMGLQGAGFTVESLREAEPKRERFKSDETYQRRRRIPLFLIMAGRKLSSQSRLESPGTTHEGDLINVRFPRESDR